MRYVGSVRRALFGGEGLFYATLTGPGLVLLQSVRRARAWLCRAQHCGWILRWEGPADSECRAHRERGGDKGGQGGGGGRGGAGANRRSTLNLCKVLFGILAFLVPIMLTLGVVLLDLLQDGNLGAQLAGAGGAARRGGGGGGGVGGADNNDNNRGWEF